MRILIYTHDFFPIGGGAQEYAKLLGEGLVRAGQTVKVATETPATADDDAKYSFAVIRKPSTRRLWQLVQEASVVQLAGPALLPLFLAICQRKPVVIEHHGYQAACPNGLLFYEPTKSICPRYFQVARYHKCLRCNAAEGWLKSLWVLLLAFPRRWLCRLAMVNAPISHHVQERLRLPRSQVIYYGIPSHADSSRPLSHTSPSRNGSCFAYVGRLVTEKGLPLLLEAAERLRMEGRDFRLKFIGDGPERARLESLVAGKGLRDHVNFTGFLARQSCEKAMEDVTALVMPSICEETAGLAAMEQMLRGGLVIAADTGGLGEIVGDAGLKFPVGDVVALTDCLKHALDQPALVQELGKQANQRALRMFRQERMVEDHLGIYQKLTRGRRAIPC